MTADELDPRPKRFGSEDEVILALEAKQEGVGLQEPIEYRWNGELLLTTPGRVIFNEEVSRALADGARRGLRPRPLPVPQQDARQEGDERLHLRPRRRVRRRTGSPAVLDTIKELGFDYATKAGITISKNDIVIPPNKEEILEAYEEQVQRIERDYQRGLITEDERHESIVNVWTEATDKVADAMEDDACGS